jgi:hypothetical protein
MSKYYAMATGIYQNRNFIKADVFQTNKLMLSAYRYDYPFCVINSGVFNTNANNHLQITLSDYSAISGTVDRIVYRINTDDVVPGIYYQPMRLDTYDQSTITFPFFDKNVNQGNNLRYNVTIDTTPLAPKQKGIFSPSDSSQKFELDVEFTTDSQRNAFKNIAWTQGGALVQEYVTPPDPNNMVKSPPVLVLFCNYPSQTLIDCGEAEGIKLPDYFVLNSYALSDDNYMIGSATKMGANGPIPGVAVIVTNLNTNRISYVLLKDNYFRDLTAQDVNIFTFTRMDTSGFVHSSFYITVTTFDVNNQNNGAVYIYEVIKDNLLNSDDELVATLKKTVTNVDVNVGKFCPTQVRHNRNSNGDKATDTEDSSLLVHILSNCAAYGDNDHNSVIVQIQAVDWFVGGLPYKADAEEVLLTYSNKSAKIEFCSLGDHYLIMEAGMSNLYRVPYQNSYGIYNVKASQYGLVRELRNLNCMPYTNQYTLQGRNSNGNVVYGLFNGDGMYNNLKFVDYIYSETTTNGATELPKKFYALNDYILAVTVGLQNIDANRYTAILNNPPRLTVDIAYIQDPDFFQTTLGYTISVYEADDTGAKVGQSAVATVSGQFTLMKPDGSITYDIIGTRNGEVGWLDIEASYTRPIGNIMGATISGGQEMGVRVTDRKTNFGGLFIKQNNYLYDQYYGDDTSGISVSLQNGVGWFQINNGTNIVSQYVLPGTQGFHADKLENDANGQPRFIVISNYGESRGKGVIFFAFGAGTFRTFSPVTKFATCDKVRIADGGNNSNFLALCLNKDTQVLTMWTVQLQNSVITVSQNLPANVFDPIYNVVDFDVTSIKDQGVELFYLSSDINKRNSIMLQKFIYGTSGWSNGNQDYYQPFKMLGTNPSNSYMLRGISAYINNNSSSTLQHNLILSTYGTKLFAVDYIANPGKGNKNWVDINQYTKPAGYDGYDMKLTDGFVVFKADKTTEPKDTGLFVYKYGKGQDPTIFTSLDLSGNTMGGVPPRPDPNAPASPSLLSNLPYAIFKHTGQDETGATVTKTVIAHGSVIKNTPIVYRAIGNMKAYLPENLKNTDVDNVVITFTTGTMNTVQTTLKDMLAGGTPGPHPNPPPANNSPVWPYFLILGILFGGAIIWFIYTRIKADRLKAANNNEQYDSIKNAETVMDGAYAKDTVQDSGLKSGKIDDDEQDALA